MKDHAVIVPCRVSSQSPLPYTVADSQTLKRQSDKVAAGLWCLFRPELDLNVASRGLEYDAAVGGERHP